MCSGKNAETGGVRCSSNDVFDYRLRLPTERRMVNRIARAARLTTDLTSRGGLVRCVPTAMQGFTTARMVRSTTGS